MRLLMTADAVGGVWQYSLDLARGLVRNGVDIVLAVMGPPPSASQREDACKIPNLELVEGDFALEWMQDPWPDVDASTKWLQSLAQHHKADVVHLNGYSYAAANWSCPVLVVAHSCVYSWWHAVHAAEPGPEWSEYRRRVTAGLEACDLVVAPTEHMGQLLQSEYSARLKRLSVIHNFSRAPRCHLMPKQPLCLAVGRYWDEAKNLRVLNKAALQAPWQIQVAGPKANPQTGAIAESALSLLGVLPHSEVLRRMREASLFLHPALYEPFGLSVLEAARSRCGLLLSDIPSLRELWDGAALFLNPRDPEAWLFEVTRLSYDETAREALALAALERSAEHSAPRAVTEYLHGYHVLVASKKTAKEVAA